MTVLSYADSALSLLPPVVAILLAILTRKVLLSLGVGILIGTFLLNQWSIHDSALYLAEKVSGLFWSDGAINSWNLYILGFLLVLGMITALITVSGSARAFANWAKQHIRKRRDAKLLTMFLGCVVFIDDYFNSLVVGSICRPLTDRYYISRAKLAYLLDSTAAPVCVISPVSSWGGVYHRLNWRNSGDTWYGINWASHRFRRDDPHELLPFICVIAAVICGSV